MARSPLHVSPKRCSCCRCIAQYVPSNKSLVGITCDISAVITQIGAGDGQYIRRQAQSLFTPLHRGKYIGGKYVNISIVDIRREYTRNQYMTAYAHCPMVIYSKYIMGVNIPEANISVYQYMYLKKYISQSLFTQLSFYCRQTINR